MNTMVEVKSMFQGKRMWSLRNARNEEIATIHRHNRPYAPYRVLGNGGTISEYSSKAKLHAAWGIAE